MLAAVLEASSVKDKFMTVHSRAAEREVVDALTEAGVTRAAIHGNGFTGTVEHLTYALDAGYCFSVVPSMLSDDRGREIVRWRQPPLLVHSDYGVISRVIVEVLYQRIEGHRHCRCLQPRSRQRPKRVGTQE